MRRLLTAVAVAFLCAGCAKLSHPSDKPAPVAAAPDAASSATQPVALGKPVNKYCPVNTKDLIDPKVLYMYNGKTYGFCCEDCIKEFQKDPEKYAAEAK